MKKTIYLFIILTVFILSGCSKKDQITNFIPTQAPDGDSDTVVDDSNQPVVPEEITATPTPKPIVVGQTTPMYVKLDEYGGTLNVRETPSTSGAKAGFLVHAEQVDVIEIVDGWASFLFNGAICYVNADYLVAEKPEYLTAPTPTPKPENTPIPEASPDI